MISDLVPDVRTHLSGAPHATVLLYLNRAAKQFCQDSLIWDAELGTVTLAANPTSARTYRVYDGQNVMGAWAVGTWAVDAIVTSGGRRYICIAARTNADTDAPGDDTEGWREVHFVAPAGAYINRISRVRIDPEDGTDEEVLDERSYGFDVTTRELTIARGALLRDIGTLAIDAVLEPLKRTRTVPQWLIEAHGEGIADYAIYEMMMMPKQEWTAPTLAMAFKTKYEARVSEATVSRARRGTRRTIYLDPFPFV